MPKRIPLTAFEKDRILDKQKNKCAICRKPLDIPHFDHKVALGLGGPDTPENQWALCSNCHTRKTREDRHKIALNKRMDLSAKDKKTILQKMTFIQIRQLAKKYDVILKDKLIKYRPFIDNPLSGDRIIHPTKGQYIKVLSKKKILQKDVDSVLKK